MKATSIRPACLGFLSKSKTLPNSGSQANKTLDPLPAQSPSPDPRVAWGVMAPFLNTPSRDSKTQCLKCCGVDANFGGFFQKIESTLQVLRVSQHHLRTPILRAGRWNGPTFHCGSQPRHVHPRGCLTLTQGSKRRPREPLVQVTCSQVVAGHFLGPRLPCCLWSPHTSPCSPEEE